MLFLFLDDDFLMIYFSLFQLLSFLLYCSHDNGQV